MLFKVNHNDQGTDADFLIDISDSQYGVSMWLETVNDKYLDCQLIEMVLEPNGYNYIDGNTKYIIQGRHIFKYCMTTEYKEQENVEPPAIETD